MPEQTPIVRWFQECDKDSVAEVGGKCASLGELIGAGIRVPPGFAVTTHGYQRFMAEAGLSEIVPAMVDGVDPHDNDRLERISAEVRERIEGVPFSTLIEDEVCEHYRKLSMLCCVPAVPVAVRSSATAEDMPDASFAGQQDTYLWIRGADDLMGHIRRCFASLFTARAIAYRLRMNYDHRQVAISVGVQKMVSASTAGVLFTLNPSNGDRSSIVINANFGFGESVVSGEVTPDEFTVSKVSLEPMHRVISKKEIYYTVDHATHSSKCFDVPLERQTVQSLLEDEIVELARMGKLIEGHYGRPMDVEWAIDKDMPAGSNVFILQARPETVWSIKQPQAVSAAAASPINHIVAAMMAGRRI